MYEARSTRIRIFLNPQLFLPRFKNLPFHTKQKYPDSLPNSPDACGRKPYPGRKSCGFKNIRIRVDGGQVSQFINTLRFSWLARILHETDSSEGHKDILFHF